MGKKKKIGKDRKGKKPKKKKKKIQKGKLYKVEGDKLTRERKSCPKCGAGVFMAEHQDRFTCGKCGFMQKK
jgi:small subunit ribosomal protein S27Ae